MFTGLIVHNACQRSSISSDRLPRVVQSTLAVSYSSRIQPRSMPMSSRPLLRTSRDLKVRPSSAALYQGASSVLEPSRADVVAVAAAVSVTRGVEAAGELRGIGLLVRVGVGVTGDGVAGQAVEEGVTEDEVDLCREVPMPLSCDLQVHVSRPVRLHAEDPEVAGGVGDEARVPEFRQTSAGSVTIAPAGKRSRSNEAASATAPGTSLVDIRRGPLRGCCKDCPRNPGAPAPG